MEPWLLGPGAEAAPNPWELWGEVSLLTPAPVLFQLACRAVSTADCTGDASWARGQVARGLEHAFPETWNVCHQPVWLTCWRPQNDFNSQSHHYCSLYTDRTLRPREDWGQRDPGAHGRLGCLALTLDYRPLHQVVFVGWGPWGSPLALFGLLFLSE
jgi:hypothetical protein